MWAHEIAVRDCILRSCALRWYVTSWQFYCPRRRINSLIEHSLAANVGVDWKCSSPRQSFEEKMREAARTWGEERREALQTLTCASLSLLAILLHNTH